MAQLIFLQVRLNSVEPKIYSLYPRPKDERGQEINYAIPPS